MPSLNIINQVKKALARLNPDEVRQESERELNIGLVSQTPEGHWSMERYFCPPELSAAKRAAVSRMLHRVGPLEQNRPFEIEIWDKALAHPEHAFSFDPENPIATVRAILKARQDLSMPLARHIFPFRAPVIDQIIQTVAKENTLFSLATALPDIVPFISLPWAIGEFASDTAFLTMNQIKMAFMIGAASDVAIGYREQKGEVGSILAGAFGFRAIARELVGHIPLGGGLIPKAAVAWSGTVVLGRSMERLYSLGYAYTRAERKSAYAQAMDKGREIAAALAEGFRRPQRSTQT